MKPAEFILTADESVADDDSKFPKPTEWAFKKLKTWL